jgi:mono/diheme cytochrome c family protein
MTRLKTLVVVAGLACAGILAFLYSGWYDVGASVRQSTLASWARKTLVNRSVAHYAAGIVPPPLDDPALVQAGFTRYDRACVSCHGAPGVAPAAFVGGLYPVAPAWSAMARRWSPAELFWTVKHGIKLSGMPAWVTTDSDRDVWAVVAFVERLPELAPADYQALRQAAAFAKDHAPESGGHPAPASPAH